MRAALLIFLLAGCRKAEPPRPQAKPAAPAPVSKQASPLPGPRPSLPATASDFNPPGVPHLAGDVHEGPSGLQYIDEVVGTGRSPTKGKQVTVHYTGWLTDGTKFDSSRDRDAPIEMPYDTGMTIKGWDLGLETMRAGGKRRLLIPAEIAYGSGGAGDAIPPDAVLLFDIELLDAQ